MKFDGIILDVDGTIWNTTPIVAEAWNKAIDQNFPMVPHVTGKILQSQFGKTMKTISDNLFSCLNLNQKNELMKKCCIEEQKALFDNSEDITYPGVLNGIENLAKNYPLFIVSNCQSGYIELVMKKNQIEKYITDFECFGNTGKEKEENIRLVMKRNNLKSPVYIGDTQGDYEACKKAGINFIWASYGFGSPDDSDYYAKINSFSELFSLL